MSGACRSTTTFMPASSRSVEQMFEPAANVDYAARFLKELKAREGSWTMAVARYHAGPDNDPAQKRYVCRVIANMVATGFGAWTRPVARVLPAVNVYGALTEFSYLPPWGCPGGHELIWRCSHDKDWGKDRALGPLPAQLRHHRLPPLPATRRASMRWAMPARKANSASITSAGPIPTSKASCATASARQRCSNSAICRPRRRLSSANASCSTT